eukprot:3931316-Amphidinium_carterae.1
MQVEEHPISVRLATFLMAFNTFNTFNALLSGRNERRTAVQTPKATTLASSPCHKGRRPASNHLKCNERPESRLSNDSKYEARSWPSME